MNRRSTVHPVRGSRGGIRWLGQPVWVWILVTFAAVAVVGVFAVFAVGVIASKEPSLPKTDLHDRTVADSNLQFDGPRLIAVYRNDEPLAAARYNGRRLLLDLDGAVMMRDGTDVPCVVYGTDGLKNQPLIVVRLNDGMGWSDGQSGRVCVEANSHGPMVISRLVWMRPWQKLAPQVGDDADRVIVFDRGELVQPLK